MPIDPTNPLLNGPRRIDARPVVRFTQPAEVAPHPDGPLFESARAGCLRLSEAQIRAARTPAGSWTRATLAGWGVSWPPPQGWKQRLLDGLPQEPSRPKAPPKADPKADPKAAVPVVGGPPPGIDQPIPDWRSPEFDSTRHGLLAPPRVGYRKVGK